MEEKRIPPTEPIRNPPPSGERILTLLYTIWAEQHGVVLSDIKITKASEEDIARRKKKTQELINQITGRKKRKCSKSSKSTESM